MLWAELESLAHAPLEDAGAVSVLRWHALSGYSLALTQYTGGRVTLADGTGALLQAIAVGGAVRRSAVDAGRGWFARPRPESRSCTRDGEAFHAAAVVVAVPLNTLGAIELRAAALRGQAGRDRARAVRARQQDLHPGPRRAGAARTRSAPGHPFGYLDTELLLADGEQLLIGFGPDAAALRRRRPAGGAARARRDPARLRGRSTRPRTTGSPTSSRAARGPSTAPAGTRPTTPRCSARRAACSWPAPTSPNGWSGFIDGAIESGLRAGAWAAQDGRLGGAVSTAATSSSTRIGFEM